MFFRHHRSFLPVAKRPHQAGKPRQCQRFRVAWRGKSRFGAIGGIMNFSLVKRAELRHDGSSDGVSRQLKFDIVNDLGILVIFESVVIEQMRQSFHESRVVFLFGSTPLNFTQGGHTGKFHVFYPPEVLHVFRPTIGLNAYDVFLFLRRKIARHRFVAVYPFNRQIAAYAIHLVLGIVALVIVEVEIGVGRHDDGMLLVEPPRCPPLLLART